MFRKSAQVTAIATTVWLIAAVAWAAPSSSVAVGLSTPDVSVDFVVSAGQVQSVSASAQCDNGNLESWTSVSVTSSTVEFGKGPNLSRVAAQADVVHVACDGTFSPDSVSIRTTYDYTDRVVRERDSVTGTRTLTTPIAGTVTLPNQTAGGAAGLDVETITR